MNSIEVRFDERQAVYGDEGSSKRDVLSVRADVDFSEEARSR